VITNKERVRRQCELMRGIDSQWYWMGIDRETNKHWLYPDGVYETELAALAGVRTWLQKNEMEGPSGLGLGSQVEFLVLKGTDLPQGATMIVAGMIVNEED